jgi:3-phenylpropionate/trans-cinnamate dioxygenase ferredoxin component
MSEWVDVVAESALAIGENVVVDVDGVDVAIFNIDGEFYAIQDMCTHDGGEIVSGILDGDEIICPRHGARFCIKTGKVKSPPAYEDIACYEIRLNNERIEVKES